MENAYHDTDDVNMKYTQLNPNTQSGKPKNTYYDDYTSISRYRTCFTKIQIDTLQKEYRLDNYLKRTRRQELAKELGLKESIIKIWFQNRRMKEKHDRRTFPFAFNGNPLYHASLIKAAAASLHMHHSIYRQNLGIYAHPYGPYFHNYYQDRLRKYEPGFHNTGIALNPPPVYPGMIGTVPMQPVQYSQTYAPTENPRVMDARPSSPANTTIVSVGSNNSFQV